MAKAKFRADQHPRDRLGRFIEIGSHVRLWGGRDGIVRRNLGKGQVEVETTTGERLIVRHDRITVTARPDGAAPIDKPADKPHAAPIVAASVSAVHDGPEPDTLTPEPVASLHTVDYDGKDGDRSHITRVQTGTVPTSAIEHLPGVSGEQPGQPSRQGEAWDALVESIKADGIKSPIFITVDPGEQPMISEGNNRRDVAVYLGLPAVPVEIRYYGHAEKYVSVTGTDTLTPDDLARAAAVGAGSAPEYGTPAYRRADLSPTTPTPDSFPYAGRVATDPEGRTWLLARRTEVGDIPSNTGWTGIVYDPERRAQSEAAGGRQPYPAGWMSPLSAGGRSQDEIVERWGLTVGKRVDARTVASNAKPVYDGSVPGGATPDSQEVPVSNDPDYARLRVEGEVWVNQDRVAALRRAARRDGLDVTSGKPDNVDRGQRTDRRIVNLIDPADRTTIVRPDRPSADAGVDAPIAKRGDRFTYRNREFTATSVAGGQVTLSTPRRGGAHEQTIPLDRLATLIDRGAVVPVAKRTSTRRTAEDMTAHRQAIVDALGTSWERPPIGARPADLDALVRDGLIESEIRDEREPQPGGRFPGATGSQFGGAATVVRRRRYVRLVDPTAGMASDAGADEPVDDLADVVPPNRFGLVPVKVPASEIQVGDRLDQAGKRRVRVVHERNGDVLAAWKLRGSTSSGVAKHPADDTVTVWRTPEAPQAPAADITPDLPSGLALSQRPDLPTVRPKPGADEWAHLMDSAYDRAEFDLFDAYQSAYLALENAEDNYRALHNSTARSLPDSEYEQVLADAESILDGVGLGKGVDLARFEAEHSHDPQPSDIDLPTPTADIAVEDAGRAARGETDPVTDEERDTDPTEVPSQTVYSFPSFRLDDAVKSIDKANRRAERAGIEARFTYTTETEWVEVKPTTGPDGTTPTGMPKQYVERVTLTLNRPTIAHDGYVFIATLTWDPEVGLVTRTAPDATLTRRPEARECDVCKSARDRKDTYIVQGPDGTQSQVGSNCLTQFMGITPAGLWMLDFEPDGSGSEGGEEGYSYGGGDARHDSIDILSVAAAVVADKGWISRKNADEWRKTATVDDVLLALGKPSSDARVRAWQQSILTDAAGRVEEAHGILDAARTIEGDSDYATNLRTVSSGETVDYRNLPLLVSAVGLVARRREAAAVQAASTSQHIGAVGDKIKNVPATVAAVRYIDGTYGVRTLLTFTTTDGNVVKWWASGRHDWEPGAEVTIKGGTIKGHSDFNGIPETEITRAKIEARGDVATAADKARQEAAAALAGPMRDIPEGMTGIDTWDTSDVMAYRSLPEGTKVRVSDGWGQLPAGKDRRGNDTFDRVPVYKDATIIGHNGDGYYILGDENGEPITAYHGGSTYMAHSAIVAYDPASAPAPVVGDGRFVSVPPGFRRYSPSGYTGDRLLIPGDLVRYSDNTSDKAVYVDGTVTEVVPVMDAGYGTLERPDGVFKRGRWTDHGSPTTAEYLPKGAYGQDPTAETPVTLVTITHQDKIVLPAPEGYENFRERERREYGFAGIILTDADGNTVATYRDGDNVWLNAQPFDAENMPTYWRYQYRIDDNTGLTRAGSITAVQVDTEVNTAIPNIDPAYRAALLSLYVHTEGDDAGRIDVLYRAMLNAAETTDPEIRATYLAEARAALLRWDDVPAYVQTAYDTALDALPPIGA